MVRRKLAYVKTDNLPVIGDIFDQIGDILPVHPSGLRITDSRHDRGIKNIQVYTQINMFSQIFKDVIHISGIIRRPKYTLDVIRIYV
tara:strand:+ start:393 stop:653 length:261 start_codon:yes stop_codon:yes gene_type:complete